MMNFQVFSDAAPVDIEILRIIQFIQTSGFTLRTFLVAAINSEDVYVRRYVKNFYSWDGPSAIVQLWGEKLWNTANDKSFVKVATQVVLRRANKELTRLQENPTLRHPSNNIHRGKIEDFDLSIIEGSFRASAPCLTDILQGLTGGSSSFLSTVGSMLLFQRSQKSNYLQMMMGLYLYSLGCPKRVISLLNDARLSVSYQSVLFSLKGLTKDALREVRSAVLEQHWFLVYDNINFPNRKYHQRIDNTDTFENGTTATIVIGADLGNEDPVNQNVPYKLDDVSPDEGSCSHFDKVADFHLFEVLKRNHDDYSNYDIPVPVLQPLPVRKTITFPLPAMAIDQSSVDGNIRVIETIMIHVLGLPKEWFDDEMRIIAGDQLTVSRIRSMQELLATNITKFDRMQWAIPVIQLFHLKMILCSTILRTHYGSVSKPGSLAFFIAKLERKRLKPDMPCYNTANEFLRNVYEAMVRRLWQVELNAEKLDVYETEMRKTGESPSVFKNKLHSVAKDIRTKYFDSYNNLAKRLGNTNRNAAMFLRDMTVYIELCAGIKSGDIGRIEEALKFVTIMLQAGGTKNYANELLRLNYGMRHAWSAQKKSAIFSSWLVNTKGLEDEWIPTDLYQEQNNLLTKTIHSAKGSNMSWDTLADTISTNIRLFSKIASKLESQYEIPFNSNYHSVMSAEIDMGRIVRALKEHDIFSHDPRTSDRNTPVVTDLMKEGMVRLVNGGFAKFVQGIHDGSEEEHVADVIQQENLQAEEYIERCFE
ncbi:hypothetical protein BGZ65_002057 [Modicella reniformis]|uniref:DUF6589 domain-containing protein n=1 Tax=Modicella reniformis TaxID=1440133 RepID=A0A9P6M9R0_9FUNG|nr:hypothetical protein BGZ65_002057 [Modicella reniformis]